MVARVGQGVKECSGFRPWLWLAGTWPGLSVDSSVHNPRRAQLCTESPWDTDPPKHGPFVLPSGTYTSVLCDPRTSEYVGVEVCGGTVSSSLPSVRHLVPILVCYVIPARAN